MELQWIKLYPDMFFVNRKIGKLRRLPEGDKILLSWIMLLSLAGKVNDGGKVYITPTEPYEVEDLAETFSFKPKLMQSALDAFCRFEMITIDDSGIIQIENWSEYQSSKSTDKTDVIREQTRERVARYRERHKAECNVTPCVTDGVTVTPIEKREERIKNIDIISSLSSREEENILYKGVEESDEDLQIFLTEDEKNFLLSQISMHDLMHYSAVIVKCEASGKRFSKPHAQAILDMATADGRIKAGKTAITGKEPVDQKQRYGNFDTEEAMKTALERTYGKEGAESCYAG